MENHINKINMENKFDFKKIGAGYLFCFNAECPKKEECIRYAVSRQIPDGICVGQAVLPPACRDGQCKYFKKKQVMTYAYSFEHIYDKVLRKHYTEMRTRLTTYLGNNGMYYSYKHGKRGLTPDQQQHIRNMFADYGYSEYVVFDRYEKQYDF